MSAPDPNRLESPPPCEALAPTQALRPDEPSSRLVVLLDGYLAELQSGRQPDRQKLLAEHPELAAQLEQCLSGIEFIHRASAPATKSGMPTQLGDFRIVREVGRGGMGVVYEAEQISLKRRVALKVLRFGAASDTEAMQRFQREAETVAGLHHTNVVPIFAIGSEQGVNYYAMQFIEGQSLADIQKVGWVEHRETHQSGSKLTTAGLAMLDPPYKIANWGLQAAEALAHAHQRGVIHRDIKPSNLILDPDGRIWLTDFGLAKRMDDVSLSMAGAILGTPRYMSPEQAAASKNPVDHRTDIYSLGATLYELATGRPLFEADSPHLVITQILTTEPPAPRLICPNLPRDFETIIVKCLAKEPERRYATAQALADDLRAFVEGRAIKARRATLAEQAARWFKQQRRSVGVAAAAVAATVFVVVGSLIAWQMHSQASLGYLTLNTPRDGDQRAEVAEVLSLNDEPVGAPFTLPTKEPLALPEGAYRLRLTAPSKVSQTYLFDIAAGAQQTHDVGLVNETVGYAIPLRSPVGVEVIAQSFNGKPKATALHQRRENNADAFGLPLNEPLLFVGPQDSSKPTLRCYSVASRLQQRVVQEGSSSSVPQRFEPQPLWEADWSLEVPDIIAFLKLPADREAWKVLPAQTDISAWQQVLAWFDSSWFRNGIPPKVLQPARDLNGDGVEDVIWSAPQLANRQQGSFGPGPLTPKAAVLVAASGKDGKPLWWFRPQDSNGSAAWLMTAPVWGDSSGRRSRESSNRSLTTSATANDGVIVCALRSTNGSETWLEAINPKSGESLWRSPVPQSSGTIQPSLLNSAELRPVQWVTRPEPSKGVDDSHTEDHAFRKASGRATQSFVVAIVGRMLVAVDLESGESLCRPHDFGESLQGPPRFADLDGDGRPEVLSISMTHDQPPQLTAMSLANRQPIWTAPVGLNSDSSKQRDPQHQWPEVVDLDGDGRSEVILPDGGGRPPENWNGVQVLDGSTSKRLWSRRFPQVFGQWSNIKSATERFRAGPDLNGDGTRELFMVSVRRENRMQVINRSVGYQRQEYFLYVDCFSGRDGQSVWWQRIPLGGSEFSMWTGTPETPIWWHCGIGFQPVEATQKPDRLEAYPTSDGWKLVLPVRRHADQGGDGIGNAGARLLFVLSAETGRVEQQAEALAFPKLVDWNNDGLDDLAVFVPDDPREFDRQYPSSEPPRGKFVVLRGSPPEAFRRLDRWVEEQDFDGDGLADLSQRYHGHGDYAIQIASGRDGHIRSKWKTEWPETPRSFTVGEVTSFALPLGDFDGDGLSDLLVWREAYFWDVERKPLVKTGKVPLLTQAISGKTGQRVWGGVPIPLPDWSRPNNDDEDSDSWKQMRGSRLTPTSTQVVDLDADGRPEVLQAFLLTDDRPSKAQSGVVENLSQPVIALIDGREGKLRWSEPLADMVVRTNGGSRGNERQRIDASTDLNGDGTRDLVVMTPQQDQQGSWAWSQTLQVQNGRDGKRLWGPVPLTEKSSNDNDFHSVILSDLDGDSRPEIVLMEAKQPRVTVLRGDTGEPLWKWQGSQPQYFASPGIAVVAQRRPVAPRQESRTSTDADHANDVQSTTNADSASGNSSRGARGLRCVAVAFNETGSQWNLVLLDHTGKELEKVPYQTNQIWSQDLDGDGDEELVRLVDNKITASRGLHDVLWSWSAPPFSYSYVSHFDRAADGRVTVFVSSGDSVTLLDGKTGKALGRTFKSTNTSLNENGRSVDLNRPRLNSAGESPRLVTRVGDGTMLLNHVVSRAVLSTDEEGRYASSPVAPRQESRISTDPEMSARPSKPLGRSAVLSQSDRAKERDDPRLVRQLPWAPSVDEWSSFWPIALLQLARVLALSLVTVLIPFWLIRAGVRRRELGWWRGMLIASGLVVIALSIAMMHSLASSPGMRGIPWGAQLAMAFGALPIFAWPTTAMRCVFRSEWRRLQWLLGGSAIAAGVLATILLATDSTQMSPEQHYSWHGWWLILLFGVYAVGSLLVAWRLFGPGVLWSWRKFWEQRTQSAPEPTSL